MSILVPFKRSEGLCEMVKILLVEDDPVLLENIAFDLEMRGYEVIQATNGAEALEGIKASDIFPDIIVSDVFMPEMNGLELLEHIRKTKQWAQIPVIFTTAFNTQESKRNAENLGVNDYVVKPFEMSELSLAIEKQIKR